MRGQNDGELERLPPKIKESANIKKAGKHEAIMANNKIKAQKSGVYLSQDEGP